MLCFLLQNQIFLVAIQVLDEILIDHEVGQGKERGGKVITDRIKHLALREKIDPGPGLKDALLIINIAREVGKNVIGVDIGKRIN